MSHGGDPTSAQSTRMVRSRTSPAAKRKRGEIADNSYSDERSSGDADDSATVNTSVGSVNMFDNSGSGPATSSELPISEVNALVDDVNASCNALLTFIGNEKLPPTKLKLQNIVKSVNAAITKISSAYISKLSVEARAGSCMETLSRAGSNIERLTANILKDGHGHAPRNNPSFADVVSRRAQIPSAKVSLSRG